MGRTNASDRHSGNTPVVTRRNSQPQVKQYVKDGYNVIESITPTSRTIIRYNDTDMSYSYDSKIVYNGPYRQEYLNILMSQMNSNMLAFDESMQAFDDAMDSLDRTLADMDTLFDEPYFSSNRTGRYQSRRDSRSSNNTSYPQSYKHNFQTTRSGGCLGCLLWSIVILAILCLVMYGMAEIGGAIIDFFKNLF